MCNHVGHCPRIPGRLTSQGKEEREVAGLSPLLGCLRHGKAHTSHLTPSQPHPVKPQVHTDQPRALLDGCHPCCHDNQSQGPMTAVTSFLLGGQREAWHREEDGTLGVVEKGGARERILKVVFTCCAFRLPVCNARRSWTKAQDFLSELL